MRTIAVRTSKTPKSRLSHYVPERFSEELSRAFAERILEEVPDSPNPMQEFGHKLAEALLSRDSAVFQVIGHVSPEVVPVNLSLDPGAGIPWESIYQSTSPGVLVFLNCCMSGGVDQSAGSPISQEEAERHYHALGRWKPPSGSEEPRQAAVDFWKTNGVAGVEWLVRRLRSERHTEVLHGVASLLADLGAMGLGPIIEGLLSDPPPDQALALLRALGWLGESASPPITEGVQAELVLAEFLQSDESDVREAAARAMRLLKPERAERWLARRLSVESDPDVRASIEEELAHHRADRT